MSKRLIQDLHAGISRRDWSAVETAANRLRDDVERTISILAGTDIGSLPNDYPLSHLAVPANAEPVAWLTIETAPKDWSDILLYDPEYESDHRKVFEGYYSCEDGGRGCWVDAGNERVNPTHWQPLPSPPLTIDN